MSKLIR